MTLQHFIPSAFLVTVSRTIVKENVGVANISINLADKIVSLQEEVTVNVSTSIANYASFAPRNIASGNQ